MHVDGERLGVGATMTLLVGAALTAWSTQGSTIYGSQLGAACLGGTPITILAATALAVYTHSEIRTIRRYQRWDSGVPQQLPLIDGGTQVPKLGAALLTVGALALAAAALMMWVMVQLVVPSQAAAAPSLLSPTGLSLLARSILLLLPVLFSAALGAVLLLRVVKAARKKTTPARSLRLLSALTLGLALSLPMTFVLALFSTSNGIVATPFVAWSAQGLALWLLAFIASRYRTIVHLQAQHARTIGPNGALLAP